MKISSLLIIVAIAVTCAGCAGIKINPSNADPAPPSFPADDQIKNSVGPLVKIPKGPVRKEAPPKISYEAPALQVAATEENCLALNVYYEAGIEQEIGKIAIAHVTLNRLNTGKWGDSICAVVYANSQFSWTSSRRLAKPSGISWDESRKAARNVIKGQRVESLKKALYYHASYVKPYWKEAVTKIQQIGRHIFYSAAKVAQAAP
jgi:spore germination cell wall hydrolase CwlJ-like protein